MPNWTPRADHASDLTAASRSTTQRMLEMKTISLNDKKFAYEVTGQGLSSVILETGLGAESSDWMQVQQLVAGFANVFRYDRLGRGESGPSNGPRDALTMVTDLSALLKAAAVPSPYLFVGHSFGGLLGQIFAQRYPAETSGLLLIESVHPAQFDLLGSAFPAQAEDDTPPLINMRRFWTEGWRNTESTTEAIDFASSFKQAPGVGALKGLPLRVLSTGSFLKVPFLPSPVQEALQTHWLFLQAQFLELSSDSFQYMWPSSGHFLQRENPNAIAAAIRDLIKLR